jgi:hypothetical protein
LAQREKPLAEEKETEKKIVVNRYHAPAKKKVTKIKRKLAGLRSKHAQHKRKLNKIKKRKLLPASTNKKARDVERTRKLKKGIYEI